MSTLNSWSRLPQPFASPSHPLSLLSAQGGVLAVAAKTDVAVSSDGGATWSVRPALPANAMALLASSSGTVAASGENPFVGVFVDQGGAWVKASGLQSAIITRKVCDLWPLTDGSILGVDAWHGNVWKSQDGGLTWSLLAPTVCGTGANAGALWTVREAPNGTFWVGGESAAGPFASQDGGLTWYPQGLYKTLGYSGNVYALGFNAAGLAVVGIRGPGNTSDAQVQQADGTWRAALGLQPYLVPQSIVTTASGVMYLCLPGQRGVTGVYVSSDGGLTWSDYSLGLTGVLMTRLALMNGVLYTVGIEPLSGHTSVWATAVN